MFKTTGEDGPKTRRIAGASDSHIDAGHDWRRWLGGRETGTEIVVLFVIVQAGAIIGALLAPSRFPYLSDANISVMLNSIPVLGVLALGVGLLMVAGEFDLSVGANYTFSTVVMAKLISEQSMTPFLAAAIALVTGTVIGLANGWITVRFKIPSFITTLGTMLFWQGAVLFVHGASALRIGEATTLRSVFAGSVGRFEAAFLWFLGLAVLAFFLLHRHPLGNRIYAVGGNVASARAVGIDPGRVKLMAFGIAGFCAAFAGILAATRVGSIQPGQGNGLELQAIAACVIGGLALMGGRGTVLGIALGAALMFAIQDILLLLQAPSFYLDVFVGSLIVGAAIFNQVASRRSV